MATITSPRLASQSPSLAAATPTSSTRGSIDLTRTNIPGSCSIQPPRRNRAALRDYYNLKNKSNAPTGGLSRTASITSVVSDTPTTTSTTVTETDGTTSTLTAPLDSADFNAESYIAKLLASSGLREVLKVEATLVSEIRNLDGDRKALVYDNYSKLIKAVGTIGEMQRGMNDDEKGGLREVEALEAKLTALRGLVGKIVQMNDASNDNAQQRQQRTATRQRVQQQAVVRRVLAAPQTLRQLIESDDRAAADREWALVKRHLAKWKGVAGADELKKECEKIMELDSSGDDHS